MRDENFAGKKDQLEDHSLPGTNQAGKTVPAGDTNDQEHQPDAGDVSSEETEEHSLPGTNQAGKGPGNTPCK